MQCLATDPHGDRFNVALNVGWFRFTDECFLPSDKTTRSGVILSVIYVALGFDMPCRGAASYLFGGTMKMPICFFHFRVKVIEQYNCFRQRVMTESNVCECETRD